MIQTKKELYEIYKEFKKVWTENNHSYAEIISFIINKERMYEIYGGNLIEKICELTMPKYSFSLLRTIEYYSNQITRIEDIDELVKIFVYAEKRFKKYPNNERKDFYSIIMVDHLVHMQKKDLTFALELVSRGVYDSEIIIEYATLWKFNRRYQILRLISRCKVPNLLLKILKKMLDGKDFKNYPLLVEFTIRAINNYVSQLERTGDKHLIEQSINRFENTFNRISSTINNIEDLEYALSLGLKEMEEFETISNFISNLRIYIKSLRYFMENGGLEVIHAFDNIDRNVKPYMTQFYFHIVRCLIKDKDDDKLLKILNSSFKFVAKEIRDSRVNSKKLQYIQQIKPRLMKYFEDFILYLMENKSAHVLTTLSNIGSMVDIGGDVSDEIKDIIRTIKSFRLYLNENSYQKIKSQDIENTYLWFCTRLGRKPKKLKKIQKSIKKFGTNHQKTGFDDINNIISNLLVDYFSQVTDYTIDLAFTELTGLQMPKYKNKDNLINAILITKKCTEYKNFEPAKEFLSKFAEKQTIHFKKYPDAYPYTDMRNLEFIKNMKSRGIDMDRWNSEFKRRYEPIFTDKKANTDMMMKDHIDEALEHFKELGYNLNTWEEMKETFEKIKDNDNKDMVLDIKTHLSYIESLHGQSEKIEGIDKVYIYVETDPLEVLQMGNVVGGSCLRLGGGNEWTTITNALDVNKKVLYAKNNDNEILGRRLITMTDAGQVIQYGIYNNMLEIDLDTHFERFTLEFASACKTITADRGNTSTLVGDQWYAGTSIVPFYQGNKQYMRRAS